MCPGSAKELGSVSAPSLGQSALLRPDRSPPARLLGVLVPTGGGAVHLFQM